MIQALLIFMPGGLVLVFFSFNSNVSAYNLECYVFAGTDS